MTARIVGLIALELVLVLAGLFVVGANPVDIPAPGPVAFVVFVALLGVLNLLPVIYLEHRRHNCLITPADGAIIVGLFTLGPFGLIAAGTAAEAIAALRLRQPPLKFVFNQVSMLGGWTVAAVTFALIGRVDPLDPVAWTAGLVAMAACALWDVVSTAALFAIVERRPFREMVNGIGPALLLSLVLSAALGLVGLVLFVEDPFAALLVVPVLAILVVSTRSVTSAKAERNRLERLYDATGRLTRLLGRQEALAAIAAEGRGLIAAGAAAICAIPRPDGSWGGVLVDDQGARDLPPVAVARLIAATRGQRQGAVALGPVPLDAVFPAMPSMVWATGAADPDVQVLLAVLLEVPADDRSDHRVDVLAAFAAHAATVVANVQLHEDVRGALDHQLALNQQKSEFVAAVSHELRTPLAGMIGSLQTIQRAHDRMTTEQLRDVLAVGESQSIRLRGLIEDLLLVAAAEHQQVRVRDEVVDLEALVAAVLVEQPADTRSRLRIHHAPAATIRTDRDKLHRIVSNLVDNARKYAPSGPIDLATTIVDGQVRIAVEDRGPGIAAADRERVFERFVQLDQSATRRQGGTGLGLHLCRELAELLGGALTLETGHDGGARFVLTVPHRPIDGTAPTRRAEHPRGGIVSSPLRRPVSPAAVVPAGVRTAVPDLSVGGSP